MKLKVVLLTGALLGLIVLGNQFISLTGNAVKEGDVVSVQYRGEYSNGTVFDESSEPLTFTVGSGQLIPGFEQAVKGLKQGEEVTVELTPSEGYGTRREELITEMNKTTLTEMISQEPEKGMKLMTNTGSQATITEVTNETITLDLNHPLSGNNLTFWIKIVNIE